MIYQKQAYTEENEVVDRYLVHRVRTRDLIVSRNLTRFCSFPQFVQRLGVELHGLADRDDLGVLLFRFGLLGLAEVADG
jgi:hypothetical protein